jgi:hypothetical protein
LVNVNNVGLILSCAPTIAIKNVSVLFLTVINIFFLEQLWGYYNSYLWAYDLYGPVRNAFDAGIFITRASGRG